MKKKVLRDLYKQKRNVLTDEAIRIYQKSIYDQVSALEIEKVTNIHVFLSLKKFKEIDTQPIIDFFRLQKKQIIVSKCNIENNTLSHYILQPTTNLKANKYGVLEPYDAEELEVKKIDLVFVPLLISDRNQYRVGYGKGYYDRFLGECRKDVVKIGINYFPPIPLIEDLNQFDIPLDLVIYPK